jgi:molybdopterin-guanine dinucleotide biosynthesis protein A
MLERVVDALGRAVDQVIVAKAHGQELPHLSADVGVVEDARPGLGPVGGLHAALSSIDGDRAVVVGCDMPFLDPSLLAWLMALDDPHDAVAPMLDGRTQTLHAVYRRACLPALETLLELGRPSLRDMLRLVDVRYLQGAELGDLDRWQRSCTGVNTPEDAARAERLLTGA